MEKTKLLTITIIGLLLLNLGTLGFLFFNGFKGHRQLHDSRPMPREIIIEKLHFDTQQQKEYDKLITWHRAEITRLDDAIRKAKNDLYSGLSKDKIDLQTKDSLISVINSNQKQVEETHFKHFEDIKKLCRKDQMENFNDLTEEFGRIFAPKPHGPRHD
ncbi:hypothetical protein [Flavobacterium sp.]|uniref:hypothetical protein n=1 Tax=Flavobacterium sp. TaxID=239 RepID=UPI0025D4C96D|nr:hypothetical protein [Flavobacterium sp.]